MVREKTAEDALEDILAVTQNQCMPEEAVRKIREIALAGVGRALHNLQIEIRWVSTTSLTRGAVDDETLATMRQVLQDLVGDLVDEFAGTISYSVTILQ